MAQTADERTSLVQVKIERAKKHITDLNSAIIAFLGSNPYEFKTKRDPQTRKLIYYVSRVTPTPVGFATIAGDAIQNLRSALDHLAQQLYLVGTGGAAGTGYHVSFPIGHDAAKFPPLLSGKVKGMRQDAIDALKAMEPYQGGKGHDLWILHTLNNIDKHRLLVTVGSSFQSVDLGAHIGAMIRKTTGRDFPIVSAFFRPADNLCPLKAGDELFIDAPDAEPNEKMNFRFNVALKEPGVIDR